MSFNEKVQAFLIARYYARLVQSFGPQGRMAFILGTQHYGMQRGQRMAQRAVRDGAENLTYEVYCQYGEWVSTEECKQMGCSNLTTLLEKQPDAVRRIDRCAWHTQFREMGLLEAGDVYCQHIDKSICRGFNPYLTYLVPETLHKSGFCTHIIKDVNFKEGEKHPKKLEYTKGFDYHCGHSYWAYSEVCGAIFGAEGEAIAARVMRDFEETYGKEMADKLASYRYTNFNIAD